MLNTEKIKADLCVVGGGVAGIHTAITAARLGLSVALVQERPVFGGNASGEIRMWICGTQDYVYKEAALGEEINLENYRYNANKNYCLWDAVLYHKVKAEKNIRSFLNCTCFDAKMDGNRISYVRAYQMTTQKLIEISATYFADCSGDSILAPLSGAKFMYGREGKSEYGEEMYTHTEKDRQTMGNSCLIQARETGKKVDFVAPPWAEKVSVEKLKSKGLNMYSPYENYWYIEIGGTENVIENAENINERLLAICLGVWDTIKNSGAFNADTFELDFLGFLGAKRESRRMLGDYVMTGNDIQKATSFYDTVAYGGWPMDDHYTLGWDGEESNHCMPVRHPYGIPYRCLYSKNVDNLFFAGRNISLTHIAMSSARVMGTCGTIGQAVGTAAAVAKKYNTNPRGVLAHIWEVQQTILMMDGYLPGVKRAVCPLTEEADLTGAADVLHNGKDRDFPGENNGDTVKNGEPISYTLPKKSYVDRIKIVFDSDLTRECFSTCEESERIHSMRCNTLLSSPTMCVPPSLAKSVAVTVTTGDGKPKTVYQTEENLRRNLLIDVEKEVTSVALTVFSNWGNTENTRLFTFEIFS